MADDRSATPRDFELPAIPPAVWLSLIALWLALTLLALTRTDAGAWHAGPLPWWLVPPFAVALLVVGPALWLLHRRVRLRDGVLEVATGIVSRKQPVAALALDRARILDLDEHTELRPLLRLFGIGLPGYSAGYCLLRNRARAFCLLTRRDRVLVLPCRDGKLLLLTPEHPQALLDALREALPGTPSSPAG